MRHSAAFDDAATESIKFNTMEPDEDESLVQFYRRLLYQAKKCNFQCLDCECGYEKRIIRDRLILFVDKYLQKEIMAKYRNPTAAEVLLMHQMDQKFQNNPGWPRILSYLSLADINILAQSHPKLQMTVNVCLKNGHPLLINQDTLCKYAVSTHRDLYSKYGSIVTNLIVTGAYGYELETLFPLFPKVDNLTLKNLELNNRYSSDNVPAVQKVLCYPEGLRKLKLVNISWHYDLGEIWMKRCWQLESLHLEGNTFVLIPDLHILNSLTLINQKASLDDLDCPFLQKITLNRYTDIQYEQLKAFPKLEHLKILQSVDWQQKEEIDKLKLKSTTVHCFEVPQEENLILRLNDDCFLHLQKYLPYENWISLHETHPRFQHLMIPYLAISKNDFPLIENKEYILPLVISLSVDNYPNADFGKLMERCSSLVDLNISLNEEQDPTDYITHIPAGLKKLDICIDVSSQILDERIVIEMFWRVNPTLITLHISDEDVENENVRYLTSGSAMLELHNIQELTYSTLNLTKDFYSF